MAGDGTGSGASEVHSNTSGVHADTHASSHDHHIWYTEQYEIIFTETVSLIVLVVLAILFEVIYHVLLHKADHSYRFGELQKKEDALQTRRWVQMMTHPGEHRVVQIGMRMKKVRAKVGRSKSTGNLTADDLWEISLAQSQAHVGYEQVERIRPWKQLLNRAAGEFMVLGYLAFVIYVFNKFGGFDVVPHGSVGQDGFSIPPDGSVYLHLFEDIHVRLFFSMVLHFISTTVTISECVGRMKTLEILQCHIFEEDRDIRPDLSVKTGLWTCGLGASGGSKFFACLRSQDYRPILAEYKLFREFFIDEIVSWQSANPDMYESVTELLHLSQTSSDVVREELDRRFDMSAYLVLIMQEALASQIQMPTRTWFVILAYLIVIAVFARCGISVPFVSILTVLHLCMLIGFTIFAVRVVSVRRRYVTSAQEARGSGTVPEVSEDSTSCMFYMGRRYKLEEYIICIWEVVRFSCLYLIALSILDATLGDHIHNGDATAAAINVTLFVLESCMLSWSGLIDVYSMLALPPFVDDSNLDKLLHVLSKRASAKPVWKLPLVEQMDAPGTPKTVVQNTREDASSEAMSLPGIPNA